MINISKQKTPLLLSIAISFCALSVLAQNAPALVEGQITCNDGGYPARGANVRLIPLASLLSNTSGAVTSSDLPIATSDFSGAYAMFPVRPGIYIVDATMPGYADEVELALSVLKRYAPIQQKSLLTKFPQITVIPGGDIRQNLIIRRAGAISGKVEVDSGGFYSQTLVTATLIPDDTSNTSANELPPVPYTFSLSSGVDDRGAYRISGLPPGSYRISARVTENFFDPNKEAPESAQRIGFADLIVFAPEALSLSEAKQFKIADGDEINFVDITIPTSLLHSITGTVTRGGKPAPGITLSLERADGVEVSTGAVSMADGFYRFDLLPEGGYTLIAKTNIHGGGTTKVPVLLNGSDVSDLTVDLEMRTAAQLHRRDD
jgi:hypothetical protein